MNSIYAWLASLWLACCSTPATSPAPQAAPPTGTSAAAVAPAASASATAPGPQAPAPAGFGGIYVFSQPHSPAAAYVSPAIDGVTILEPWATMEPQAGTFDWTDFDAIAAPAIAAGKKLSVGVLASAAAVPDWLFAVPYSLGSVSYQVGNGKQDCHALRAPEFWQPTFLENYERAVAALAAHMHALPGGWDAMRIYKLGAIATGASGELRAGVSDPDCPDGAGTVAWLADGYTTGTALQAWRATTTDAALIFPSKELAQDVLTTPQGTAPPEPLGTPSLQAQIIAAAASTYGHGIIIQNDNLNLPPITPAQPVLDAQKAGALIGWQTTAGNGSGGARCGTGPCDAAGFAQLLALGKQLGGVTLEIHPADVAPFQGDLSDAIR